MELKIFEVGKIFNKVQGNIGPVHLKHSQVKVVVPARLNAMCFDIKTLAKPQKKFIYNAGELAFSVNLNTYATIWIQKDNLSQIKIAENTLRKSIVKHAALIMKKTLKIKESILIEANNLRNYPHSGLGSSSALITAVCIGINEAYGKPLSPRQLTLFISQNHGEEIRNEDEKLVHVQCNGGSPSVALYGGGMQIIVGESNMLLRESIPQDYTFVFGIPSFYKEYDAQKLMTLEKKQFLDMLQSSKDSSDKIAWKVLHELIPSIMEKKMFSIGNIIEYYRFRTNSLRIDSRTWKGLYYLVKSLLRYKCENTPIVSISSCGPAIYILTKNPNKIKEVLAKRGMRVFLAKPNNLGYHVSYNFK